MKGRSSEKAIETDRGLVSAAGTEVYSVLVNSEKAVETLRFSKCCRHRG